MGLRTVLVVLAGAAYVAGTHWLMTAAPATAWNALIVVAPMLIVLVLFGLQRRQGLVAAAGLLALAGLAIQAWQGGGLAPRTLYLAQHVGIHLALATAFASTLRRGQEALITALARRVHGVLSPAMAAYSRRVTLLWTAYFVAMAALSLALFVWAPFGAWAVFANLATPVAMVALFIGEYLFRYRRHPEFERATLSAAIGAYSRRHTAPVEGRP